MRNILNLLARLVILILLPIILPIVIFLDLRFTRRLRRRARTAACAGCGEGLGPEALSLADAEWSSLVAKIHQDNPRLWRSMVRRLHAICPACKARHAFFEREDAFKLAEQDFLNTKKN